MTNAMYKKSVVKFNNNKSKEKDRERKKANGKTPTNNGRAINNNNTCNNTGTNFHKPATANKTNKLPNPLVKSVTINPSKKMEKPDNKTERPPNKKVSAPSNGLNASWNLTIKNKDKKKENIPNSKFNNANDKSPTMKMKKKNSKTPKNYLSKSKEIDKDFLLSLTGNLQSLISNIEGMEKVSKKNTEQAQNVK